MPLPVVQPRPKIRPSKRARWRAAVLIAVHLLIAAHIAHWLLSGRTLTPVEPSEAIAFARGGVVNAGLIFFAATILLTAVFGRFFCGWACHLVALQDLCRWLLAKVGIRPRPLRSRLLRLVPALAFAYMFLWPLIWRLGRGDSLRYRQVEMTTAHFWATFPGWLVGGLTFLVCGFVIVYFLGAKGFCTYACPYGAIFGVAEKVSPLRIRVTDACAGCAHCTAVCSSNVRVHEEVRDYGMVVDSGCMKCMDCVSVCPNDALYYGAGPIAIGARGRRDGARSPARRRRLPWWEELLLAAAFAAAFFTFRGLYGAVPFLLSLGLAAVLAFAVATVVKLALRDDFTWQGKVLRRGGQLRPAGRLWLAATAAVLLLWSHSAVVRFHAFAGERAFHSLAPLPLRALEPGATVAALSTTEAQTTASALRHLEQVRRWGLIPTAGNAARRAWLYHRFGRPAEAGAAARLAISRGEEVAAMDQLLGATAWQQGERRQAVDAYRRAVEAAPDSAAARLHLGIALARSGELHQAGEVFDRGRQLFPESSDLAYNAGLVRALDGDTAGAIARFEQALAIEPQHLEARENLAGVLASVGRYDDSIAQYRRALAQSPDDPATRLLLARVLASAGDEAAAAEELRQLLAQQPGLEEAESLLARIEARQAKAPDGR